MLPFSSSLLLFPFCFFLFFFHDTATTEIYTLSLHDAFRSNDIVGGNSGSPLIDAQGRLVGLMFDGNIHSIAGSYWYDPQLNRAVAVRSEEHTSELQSR